MVQKSKQMELPLEDPGAARKEERSEQAPRTRAESERPGTRELIEKVVSDQTIGLAAKRVKSNKGAPGIDGMTVDELDGWLREHWSETRAQLLAGKYKPKPVRRVMIPKRGGGERELGIPTVVDRLIQQAILVTLQPRLDPTFSESSFGFRPGRSAHGAVAQMREIVAGGREWVVDVDLEKFFDRVNHDMLMGRMAKRVEDREILRLIRRYLNAGVMANGVKVVRGDGTPQGGPLSPLLANVYLDEVDKELEKRGHQFVRYADDLRVLVGSERAGHRVMRWLVKRFEKLKLRVNESKSTVARVYTRPFLSFDLWKKKSGEVKIGVSSKALDVMKERIRVFTKKTRGRRASQVVREVGRYLKGWWGYFRLTERVTKVRTIMRWVRRRLRMLILHQWKTPRRTYQAMRKLGATRRLARDVAANTGRWWRLSKGRINHVLTNKLFEGLGLPALAS